MTRLSRRTALLTAAATSVALAAPAFAAGSGVAVSLTGLGGTRQFSVEDIKGSPLTALDLGYGRAKPFRTHVSDSAFLPLSTADDGYSVSATMNNLYRKNADSSPNYAVSIPSSALAIGFGTNPLAGSGVSLQTLPRVSLSGTLASCAALVTSAPALATALGLGVTGLLQGLPLDPANTALTSLCTALGSAGGPIAATVDGKLRDLAPLIASVANLPSVLSGAIGGTFTKPDFAAGTVGAGDPAAAGAVTATSVSLMSGTHNLSAGLIAALQAKLAAVLATLPLASSTVDSVTTNEAIVAGLAKANDAASTSLALVLGQVSAANATTIINGILTTVAGLAPALSDITGINGQYFSFPILTAAPTTPAAGTYTGTMTVTFVQN